MLKAIERSCYVQDSYLLLAEGVSMNANALAAPLVFNFQETQIFIKQPLMVPVEFEISKLKTGNISSYV